MRRSLSALFKDIAHIRLGLPQSLTRLHSCSSSSGHTQLLRRITTTFPNHAGPASSIGSSASPLISLTEDAKTRLKELLAQDPRRSITLRVSVESGGCSGFQYTFQLTDQQDSSNHGGSSGGDVTADDEDDIVVDQVEGAKVVTDNVSLELLKGSTIGFEDSLIRSAFVIESNPQADSACGCGSSFVAKM